MIKIVHYYDDIAQQLAPHIVYGCGMTPFGAASIAFIDGYVCKLAFTDRIEDFAAELQREWQRHTYTLDETSAQAMMHAVFQESASLNIVVRGSSFQRAVWDALLCIPSGTLVSYSAIAEAVGKPRAVRAVATAIGDNRVAYFIPCHRVIRRDGTLGGYRWGLPIKQRLLALEKKAQ